MNVSAAEGRFKWKFVQFTHLQEYILQSWIVSEEFLLCAVLFHKYAHSTLAVASLYVLFYILDNNCSIDKE